MKDDDVIRALHALGGALRTKQRIGPADAGDAKLLAVVLAEIDAREMRELGERSKRAEDDTKEVPV